MGINYNGRMLGETVQRARCGKGWSIPQLSKRSGVPGRLIQEIEGGSPSYVPGEANTMLLAEALRVHVGSLLERWHNRDAAGKPQD